MSLKNLTKKEVEKASSLFEDIETAVQEARDVIAELDDMKGEDREERIEELDDKYSELMSGIRELQGHWTDWQIKL